MPYTIGLSFFTVFETWVRLGIALFKFTKAFLTGERIQVFKYSKHRRDFTYAAHLVVGVNSKLDRQATLIAHSDSNQPDRITSLGVQCVYNIGNCQSEERFEYIAVLEVALFKTAIRELLTLQLGDVPDRYTKVGDLVEFHCKPATNLTDGIQRFVNWYRAYCAA